MLSRKAQCWSHYRLSDVIIAICIPASVVMTVYVTLLSREIQNVTISPTNGIGESGTQEVVLEEESSKVVVEEKSSPAPYKQHILHPKKEDLNPNARYSNYLNNTKKSLDKVLVMTSIFRTGQSSLREILKELKYQNKFSVVSPPANTIRYPSISPRKQGKFVKNVYKMKNDSVIFNDFAFINFKDLGADQPIHVAMIRDPVELLISKYYAVRMPYKVVEDYNRSPYGKLPSKVSLKKSLEACLLSKMRDLECQFTPGSKVMDHTMRYFCGQDPICENFADEAVLEEAIGNVERYYAVVGVLEDFEKTLVVLEHYVPKFFKGAYKAYKDILNRTETKYPFNMNMYKPSVDKSARNQLEKMFSVEREFYNRVRERLNEQYEEIVQAFQYFSPKHNA